MRSDRRPSSRVRRAKRGFALLLTLMVLMVIGLIVAQVTARVAIENQRTEVRSRERQCRRALDSTVGIAMRLLTESTEDLRIDHLGEEWTRAKTFQIGETKLDISIIDCERLYDLKGLLENGDEESQTLEDNKQKFMDFAEYCGLEATVARNLAEAIVTEAEIRRQEDAVWAEMTGEASETGASETSGSSSGTSGSSTGTSSSTTATTAATETESRPVWLEDFLSLPQLTDDDRKAITAAVGVREDPETGEQTTFRFMDLLTIWRSDKVNVNTAGREVLMFTVPGMVEQEEALDNLIEARDTEPLKNTSQIKSDANLDTDQASQVTQTCDIKSRRFRVTATATLVGKKGLPQVRQGRMIVILERTGNNEFKVLWRSVNL